MSARSVDQIVKIGVLEEIGIPHAEAVVDGITLTNGAIVVYRELQDMKWWEITMIAISSTAVFTYDSIKSWWYGNK